MQIKREVKLAVTAIAAVIILIWGINFLKAKALFDRNSVYYGIYERVDGLKVSSSVIYRGYSVGQVNSIRFFGNRFDKILVEFSIGKNLEIPANSTAAIQSTDLMGSKAINILPGDAIAFAQNGDTLKTHIELGLMEQVNEQLAPLKGKAENILASMDSVLTVLESIFNDETKGNITGSLASINVTLKNVEHASGGLDNLITGESARISDILANINSITANLKQNNNQISRSLDNFTVISDSLRAVNIVHTVRGLNKVLCQVDSVVGKINRGKGTLGEVVNDDDLYYNLTAVSENLNKLLIEFKANPKKFVNLSIFDFTSNKMTSDAYGIVIFEADKPLALNSDLYLKYPDLKEIKHKGYFLYLVDTFKNLKQAQKELEVVKKYYKDAYIVKIP